MDVKAKFMEIRLEGNGRILGPLIAVVPGLGKKYLEGMRRINDARTNELLNVAEKHKQIQERFSSGGVNIKTELTLDKDGINQKITLPVLDRIQNFEAVVDKAESMVGENTIEDKPMDDNWKAPFYDAVVDISLEDTQEIWARVLAREIQNPGSTSTRALGILKTLDKSTAQIFEKICSMCFVFGVGPYIFDARVPCLSGNAGNNVLQKYGLTFGDLNCLQEHTLVISNYNSQHDYMVLTTGKKIEQQNQMSVIPFQFQGKLWVLNATQELINEQD